MKYSSSIIEQAVEAFSALPSIGKKSALRLVLHLANDQNNKKSQLISSLELLEKELKICAECFGFSDTEVCSICANRSRSSQTLCVVESIRDLIAIEETESFRGKYHVLGGVISPLEGIGPENLNIDALLHRVKEQEVEEIIMALSPTIDGETTIFYLSKLLKDSQIKISTIARGVSFGGELAYADELTLGRSILKRQLYTKESLL